MLKDGEIAEIASAAFTAAAAAAAFMSVARVERDRRNASIPDLHIDVIGDAVNNEMRMTIANLSAPAREVRTMGTIGDFGWFTPTPPTAYWRSGESRTYRLAMPFLLDTEVQAFVEARAIRMRQLVVATVGGTDFRWSLRKLEQMSPASEWAEIYPDDPNPTQVSHSPIAVELVERTF
jgi:hypothetical protein